MDPNTMTPEVAAQFGMPAQQPGFFEQLTGFIKPNPAQPPLVNWPTAIRDVINAPTRRRAAEMEAIYAPAPGYVADPPPPPVPVMAGVNSDGAGGDGPMPPAAPGPMELMGLVEGGAAPPRLPPPPAPNPRMVAGGRMPPTTATDADLFQIGGMPRPPQPRPAAPPRATAPTPAAQQARPAAMPQQQAGETAEKPDALRQRLEQLIDTLTADAGKPIEVNRPPRRDLAGLVPSPRREDPMRQALIDFGLGLATSSGGRTSLSVGRAGERAIQAMRGTSAANDAREREALRQRLALAKFGLDSDAFEADQAFKQAQLGETVKGRQLTATGQMLNALENREARKDTARINAQQRSEDAARQRQTLEFIAKMGNDNRMAMTQLMIAGRADVAEKALQEKEILRSIEQAKSEDQFYERVGKLAEQAAKDPTTGRIDWDTYYKVTDTWLASRGFPPLPRQAPQSKAGLQPGMTYAAPDGQQVKIKPEAGQPASP